MTGLLSFRPATEKTLEPAARHGRGRSGTAGGALAARLALLMAVGIGVPVASFAGQTFVETPKVVGLEGEDLYRARHVIRRFFRQERRPECYRVLFSQDEGNLRVDFVPKNTWPVVVQEGEEPPVVPAPCGQNVGYVLDRRGAILRRVYIRQ